MEDLQYAQTNEVGAAEAQEAELECGIGGRASILENTIFTFCFPTINCLTNFAIHRLR